MADILDREVIIVEQMNCFSIHKPSLLGGYWCARVVMDEIKCANFATARIEIRASNL